MTDGMSGQWIPVGDLDVNEYFVQSVQLPCYCTVVFKGVRGVPTKGTTMLLFEDDVVALARHLVLRGLIVPDESGNVVNGRAEDYESSRRVIVERRRSKKVQPRQA